MSLLRAGTTGPDSPSKLGELLFEALKAGDEERYAGAAFDDADFDSIGSAMSGETREAARKSFVERMGRARAALREDFRWIREAARKRGLDWDKARMVLADCSLLPGRLEGASDGFVSMTLCIEISDSPGKQLFLTVGDGACIGGVWKLTDGAVSRRGLEERDAGSPKGR